jgi:hypothetical protein
VLSTDCWAEYKIYDKDGKKVELDKAGKGLDARVSVPGDKVLVLGKAKEFRSLHQMECVEVEIYVQEAALRIVGQKFFNRKSCIGTWRFSLADFF